MFHFVPQMRHTRSKYQNRNLHKSIYTDLYVQCLLHTSHNKNRRIAREVFVSHRVAARDANNRLIHIPHQNSFVRNPLWIGTVSICFCMLVQCTDTENPTFLDLYERGNHAKQIGSWLPKRAGKAFRKKICIFIRIPEYFRTEILNISEKS